MGGEVSAGAQLAVTVLAVGGMQLLGTALTVLLYALAAVGAVVLLLAVTGLVLSYLAWRADRREPAAVVFGGMPPECEWCEDLHCADPFLCQCHQRCGVMHCKAPAEVTNA